MSEEKKYLDEEDLLEEETESGEEPTEPESEVEKEEPSDEEVEEDEPVEEEPEEVDWQEEAKKAGWVPDHVREKHAREAQTLRDQVKNLQRLVTTPREEVDPNEVVRYGDLEQMFNNLRQNIEAMKDPALISETMMRSQVADYDDVIVNYVEPLAESNPWLPDVLRADHNPAGTAYKIGCALRDGRKVGFGFKDGKMSIEIEEEKQSVQRPKKKDPSRPPVEALEQAKKQPKSLDEVPSASDSEATQMSVEDFWRLPSDTLMRLRMDNPDMYEKMRQKFQEKYG